MNHEDLKAKAKSLGIKDVETPSYNQLKKIVSAKEAELAHREELEARADELGLDHENVETPVLEAAIKEEEARIAQEAAAGQESDLYKEMVDVLSEHLGEDLKGTSAEALKALLEARDHQLVVDAVASAKKGESGSEKEVDDANKGKTDKAFKAQSGKEYQFSKDAPAAFRYMGALKTQEEWMEDAVSMQLMVSGNLSYLSEKRETYEN